MVVISHLVHVILTYRFCVIFKVFACFTVSDVTPTTTAPQQTDPAVIGGKCPLGYTIGHVSADHDITLKPLNYLNDWNFIYCFGHSL